MALAQMRVKITLPAEIFSASTTASNAPVLADVQAECRRGRWTHGEEHVSDYKPQFSEAVAEDSLERMANRRTKKNKEMRLKISSHLNISINTALITHIDAHRSPNHLM